MENLTLNERTLKYILSRACGSDDVSLMSQCFTLAQRTDSKVTLQHALDRGLEKSTKMKAMKCLSYALDQGADVNQLSPQDILGAENTSISTREVLELLIANGWDINSEGSGAPILWHVVNDHELVKWCLDHGADVNPSFAAAPGSCNPLKPILERAASTGNITTFELLRNNGAPLDRNFGVFPVAVMVANECASDATNDRDSLKRRIEMLRHLLEVVGCDVNSNSFGGHYDSGSICSTPLCWIACHPSGIRVRELIWFLLDHGGDLDRTLEYTDQNNKPVVVHSARDAATGSSWRGIPNRQFLEAVQEWEAQQRSTTSSERHH